MKNILVFIQLIVIFKCSYGVENRNPHSQEACSSSEDAEDIATSLIKEIHSKVTEAECELANPSDYPEHYTPNDGEQFDFIVVGGGSAGTVVASRLSEEASWSVLLLEAGGDPTKSTEVPGLYGVLQRTSLDWQFKSDPGEDKCLAMVNKSCNWPRGKVLGGSSTINGMIYVRGNREDYDAWSRAGNEGWDYESVLEYFKKSESIRAEEVLDEEGYKDYHGEDGYLSVESFESHRVKEIVEAYGKGMEEMGYKWNHDCNGKSQTGFVKLQATLVNKRRCNAAKAFLKPAKSRTNLKVSKYSLATKILIDEKSKEAYGVEFVSEGRKLHVRAKKEVIVSAGSINTPQLLMLSGIGPKEHLEEMDIDVIQDLPVGENLQDHSLMVGLVFSYNYTRPVKKPADNLYDYISSAPNNAFSGIGMLGYAGFINTLNVTSDIPDVQIHHYDIDVGDKRSLHGALSGFGIRDEVIEEFHKINSERLITPVMPTLLKPYSRGKILLNSKDPMDKVRIVTGFLTDERDVETLLRATEFLSNLASTQGLATLDTKFHEVVAPGCSQYPAASRDFRVCSLRHFVTTCYHPTSTCRMGPPEDPAAVVSPRLGVKGVARLRVADASVMPGIVRGNTNAPTVMIGEKAADLIKQDWL